MKKIIATLLLIQLAVLVTAQITVTSDDMPQANNAYTFSNANIFGDFNLDGGEDMSWDYDFLESLGFDSLDFVSVSDAPFAYQFLFNNPFIPDYEADFALHTPDVDLGGVLTMEDNYLFYQNNDEDYRILGMGIVVNDIPGVGMNDPIDIVYNFPMNYDDADTSYTELNIEIPGLYFYNLEQTRRNYVDGWGTISLPIGDYECLRVRTEIEAVDSIYINLLDIGFALPRPMAIEYKWISMNQGIPVLQINETGGVITQIQYKDTLVDIPDNISESLSLKVKIFPNPVSSYLSIRSYPFLTGEYKIFDTSGRLVKSREEDRNIYQIDVRDLNNGEYLLLLNSEEGWIRKSFIKEN